MTYFLPSVIVAETFTFILSVFISVLAFLSNLALDDAQDNLNNATLFQQPGFDEYYSYVVDNYTDFEDNYTVTVSNAVLWVCREGSTDGDFYRTCYKWAIAILIIFHILTTFSRFFTAQFWKNHEVEDIDDLCTAINLTIKSFFWKDASDDDDKLRIAIRMIIGAFLFNLAFLMLLLSFDISPWSCIQKPSTISVDYIPQTNRFDIQIDPDPGAIRFQKGAPIIAVILIAVWVAAHVFFIVHDCCKGVGDIDETDHVPLELSQIEAAEGNDDNDDDD